jgi:hypothetical protein
MGLKKDIKKVLKEYGCLHKGGKLWDKVIRKQRNKDLVNALFALYDVGSAFYCQRDIEGESICDSQCEHCEEYYRPLEQ